MKSGNLEAVAKDAALDATQDATQDVAVDVAQLQALGYKQELARRMKGFSNFAISFSIICILAGGITSFHLAFCATGGAGVGLGWPIVTLLALATAAAMGQVASAFPTAGGVYHWASFLGGKAWGWFAAWFNLAGLVTVLAAINVGTVAFLAGALGQRLGFEGWSIPREIEQLVTLAAVAAITASQAVFNHLGIRITTRLTDFSGYLILVVAAGLVVALWAYAPTHDLARLVTFSDFSGKAGGDVWPAVAAAGNGALPLDLRLAWLFALGFLLPGYTMTGFDASANTSEETVGAATAVPKAMLSAVLISGVAGWILVATVVLAMPDLAAGAAKGAGVFFWTVDRTLPPGIALALFVGIGMANYLCGLATVTSASRMLYAFARDGGVPFSGHLAKVSPRFQTPAAAIWTVAAVMLAFTVYTPVYATITIVCIIFLYLSYTLPIALGLAAYGRSWTTFGPWTLGPWFRPVGVVAVLWCALIVTLGMQPPYDKAGWIVGGTVAALAAIWFGFARNRFPGPPHIRE
jgi:amino acid transporter